jgi:hypothetical protein
MQAFVDSLRQAIAQKNWISVLTLSLTLPDICAGVDHGTIGGSKRRYVKWYDDNLRDLYGFPSNKFAERSVLLSGEDCYALRCALLHEGTDDITSQRARRALDRFIFIAPPPNGNTFHCNQVDNQLQLQVDKFGEDVANAVEKWWNSVIGKDAVNATLLQIRNVGSGFSL